MMKPLMGTYNPSMDDKGRIAFPAKLREQLGNGFYVTIGMGFEGCLYVYSEEEFDRITEKLEAVTSAEGRQAVRLIMSRSEYLECDKQGRIKLNENLCRYAGIEHGRDITVIGNRNRAEIWDSVKYEAQNVVFTNEQLAAALDGIAF